MSFQLISDVGGWHWCQRGITCHVEKHRVTPKAIRRGQGNRLFDAIGYAVLWRIRGLLYHGGLTHLATGVVSFAVQLLFEIKNRLGMRWRRRGWTKCPLWKCHVEADSSPVVSHNPFLVARGMSPPVPAVRFTRRRLGTSQAGVEEVSNM